MTKKKTKPKGIPIDPQGSDALRFLVANHWPSWANKIIGKLLEDRIIEKRQPGQSMAENLAPAAALLDELRQEVSVLFGELQRGRLPSWRSYVKVHPPSPEAITLKEWAAMNYSQPPSSHTLRRWRSEMKIYPEPERVGNKWFVVPEAKLLAESLPHSGYVPLVERLKARGR